MLQFPKWSLRFWTGQITEHVMVSIASQMFWKSGIEQHGARENRVWGRSSSIIYAEAYLVGDTTTASIFCCFFDFLVVVWAVLRSVVGAGVGGIAVGTVGLCLLLLVVNGHQVLHIHGIFSFLVSSDADRCQAARDVLETLLKTFYICIAAQLGGWPAMEQCDQIRKMIDLKKTIQRFIKIKVYGN